MADRDPRLRIERAHASVAVAERLRHLIEDPDIRDYFARQERLLTETAITDKDEIARDDARRDVLALRNLRAHFETLLRNGAANAEIINRDLKS